MILITGASGKTGRAVLSAGAEKMPKFAFWLTPAIKRAQLLAKVQSRHFLVTSAI